MRWTRRVTRVSESVRSKLLLAACAALAGVSATSALAQTITVTSLADSGPGTLRDAITQANGLGTGAIIKFNAGSGTQILLSSMLPVLENPHGIQIDGFNGGQRITLNGGRTNNTNGDRIFFVGVAPSTPAAGGGFLPSTATTNFAISNFIVTNGNARGGAGGYEAGGGAGMGGGLFLNAGTLTLSNVQFNANLAIGGAGGALGGGGGGGGMGGAGGSGNTGGSGGGGFGVNASVEFNSGGAGGPGAFANGATGGNGNGGGGAGGTFGGGGGSAALFGGGGGGGGVGGVSATTSGNGGNGGFGGGGGGGGVVNGGATSINGGAGGFGGGGGGHEGSSNSAGIGGFGGGGGSNAAGGFGGGAGGPYSNQTGGRGGAGAGLGGGIFVRQGASLNVVNGGFSSDNSVLGGSAGAGAGFGQQRGGAIFLAGALSYTVGPGNTATVSSSIGGGFDAQITSGFIKTGPGTLVLVLGTPGSASSFTGGVVISTGTLAVGHDDALGDPSNVVTLGGGALSMVNDLTIAHAINIPTSFTGTVDTNGYTGAIYSQIGGGGALYKTGDGVLELHSANTFSGGVVVDKGALAITSDAALGPVSNIMSINGGTLRTDASMTLNRSIFVFSPGGTVDTNGNAVSEPNQVAGSAGFIKTGSGMLTLSYNNNTQLSTRINDGVLSVPFDQALGVGGGTLYMGGGTLQITNTIVNNNRPMNLIGGTASTIDTNGNLLLWNGPITETGAGGGLTKTGGGLLYIQSNTSYTGTTTVNAGSIVLNGSAWAPVFNNGGADIKGGRLVFDYSAATNPGGTVGLILQAGYGQSPKFSSGKLRTSNPADPNKGLGWIDNTSLKGVFVAYTWYGDSNLDGKVDVTDLGTLATHWQTSGVWSSGDFNYDGFVDVTDLGLLATNWQAGVGSPLGTSFDEAIRSVGLGGLTVPEPASICVMGLISVGAMRRRRPIRS